MTYRYLYYDLFLNLTFNGLSVPMIINKIIFDIIVATKKGYEKQKDGKENKG